MKKFMVIAVKWDDSKMAAVNYIAGEFYDWNLARIFRDAYNDHYNANAVIVEMDDFINNNIKL